MAGPAPSITYAVDGPNAAPAQGDVLYYDGAKWGKLAPGTAGQALLTGGAGANPSWGSAGVTDHGALTGLGDDDHAQYALLAGRAGGQTLIGGTASGDDLYLLASTQTGNPAAGVYRTVYIGSDPGAPTTYGIAVSRNGDGGGAGVGIALGTGSGWNDTLKFFTVGSKYIEWQSGVWTTAGTNYNVFAAGASTYVPLIVRGAASQSANLQEWQNSAGTVLASVGPTGNFNAPNISLTSQLSWTGTPSMKLTGGGTLTLYDGASAILATFVHGNGGTLRNNGTTRIEWNATGIGFFAATPVARAAALTAADASALNTGDATSDTVIGNIRTRLGELESRLQAYGLLT